MKNVKITSSVFSKLININKKNYNNNEKSKINSLVPSKNKHKVIFIVQIIKIKIKLYANNKFTTL